MTDVQVRPMEWTRDSRRSDAHTPNGLYSVSMRFGTGPGWYCTTPGYGIRPPTVYPSRWHAEHAAERHWRRFVREVAKWIVSPAIPTNASALPSFDGGMG
jgi:hypothetical protein